MYEIIGVGDKPEKEAEIKKKESNDLNSHTSFTDNLKTIMVTYKVAQAFKAQQKKKPRISRRQKITGKALRKKSSIATNMDKANIKKTVQNFIRNETMDQSKIIEEYISKTVSEAKPIDGISQDESERTQNFFLLIADFCFRHNIRGHEKAKKSYNKSFVPNSEADLGLTDLIGKHIYDIEIEGLEYQVISPKEFFLCLHED